MKRITKLLMAAALVAAPSLTRAGGGGGGIHPPVSYSMRVGGFYFNKHNSAVSSLIGRVIAGKVTVVSDTSKCAGDYDIQGIDHFALIPLKECKDDVVDLKIAGVGQDGLPYAGEADQVTLQYGVRLILVHQVMPVIPPPELGGGPVQ